MARQDHREFHDLCKKLLSFEPNSRVTAARAVEHEFFHLDITPEYSEESLLTVPRRAHPATDHATSRKSSSIQGGSRRRWHVFPLGRRLRVGRGGESGPISEGNGV